jgi:hypothetical protein
MRTKATGLAQHGGPPGWLEKSDPAGCDFERNGRSMPPVLTGHTIALLLNVHKTPPWWKSPIACASHCSNNTYRLPGGMYGFMCLFTVRLLVTNNTTPGCYKEMWSILPVFYLAWSQPMRTAVHRSPIKLWRANSIFNLMHSSLQHCNKNPIYVFP